MDPITIAIVTALGKLSESAIMDAYKALKAAIAQKCGVNSDLFEAIENLEKKPDSEGQKLVLAEEVSSEKVDQDPDIRNAANILLNKLSMLQDTVNIRQTAGDNAVQIGQINGGRVDINQERD